MSDSDTGVDLTDVKTSNSPSEEDADEVASTRTPLKRGSKAKPKYVFCLIHSPFFTIDEERINRSYGLRSPPADVTL